MKKETINNIKIIALILVVFIILYILHITIGPTIESQYEYSGFTDEQNIFFETDLSQKTLTVSSIHPQDRDFYWSEISVVNGSANLPTGIIEVGDIITNCEGYLELEWSTTGIKILERDFR